MWRQVNGAMYHPLFMYIYTEQKKERYHFGDETFLSSL